MLKDLEREIRFNRRKKKFKIGKHKVKELK